MVSKKYLIFIALIILVSLFNVIPDVINKINEPSISDIQGDWKLFDNQGNELGDITILPDKTCKSNYKNYTKSCKWFFPNKTSFSCWSLGLSTPISENESVISNVYLSKSIRRIWNKCH